MTRSDRLLFGPVSAAIFCVGVAGLPLMVPGYSHVHQTVSEIGEVGSPARIPFTVMLACVAACTLIFASAIRDFSSQAGRSKVAAYLTACSALSALGVGIFAFQLRKSSELVCIETPGTAISSGAYPLPTKENALSACCASHTPIAPMISTTEEITNRNPLRKLDSS